MDSILPQSSVLRVIKGELPEGSHISGEAKGSLSRAAAIFALNVASTASDLSKEAGRRTVTAGDIARALEELDLPEFVEALRGDLGAFKDSKARKRQAAKQQRQAEEAEEQEAEGEEGEEGGDMGEAQEAELQEGGGGGTGPGGEPLEGKEQ
jgi:DNA polymerase epsilon subunit 3